MKNKQLHKDVIHSLEAMGHTKINAGIIARRLMENCDTEEDIIKAINNFGEIRGSYVP